MYSQSSSDWRDPATGSRNPGGTPTLLTVLATLALLLWSSSTNARALNDTERYRIVTEAEQPFETAQRALEELRKLPAPARASERQGLFVSVGVMKEPLWVLTPIPANTAFVVISGGWQDLYQIAVVSGDKVLESYASGSRVPASDRPQADPRTVVRLPADAADLDLLVHDAGRGTSVGYPIEFQSESEYGHGLRMLHLRHGLYYGLVLMLCCIGIGAAIVYPQPASVYFTTYLVSLTVVLSCQDGFLGFYLLPNHPALLPVLPHLGLGVVYMSALLFGLHFLGMEEHAPKLARVMRLLAGTLLAHGLVNGALQSQVGSLIESFSSLLVSGLLMVAAVIASRNQVTGAKVYLLSRFPTLLATVAVIANTWTLQSIAVTLDALFVGAALEVFILSIALLVRIAAQQRASVRAAEREQELGAQIHQLQLITEEAHQLRKVQHSAQEIHRVRTINQIAGGVAHDFNNILTSVMGFAELLKDEDLKIAEPQRRKFGAEIHKAGTRGARLVEQLLTYSRSATTDVASQDVVELTLEALSLVKPGLAKRVKLDVTVPNHPLRCMLDAKQWRQVVVNLVTNAAESMNGDGIVDITLKRGVVPAQQCSACRAEIQGERVIMTVSDSGGGIEEPISDLFTPFHTTKSIGNGSGLGLSVVDGIVHEHGGHLVMANRPNRAGVQVEIVLPCQEQHSAGAHEQMQLLLVSSDDAAVTAIRDKLQRYYEVTSEQRASSAIATFLNDRTRFGLVAIEVQADDQQWLEVASNVRRASPATPILFLTADWQASQVLKGHSELQRSRSTQTLNAETEIDLLLTTIETMLKPDTDQTQNIASLRTALHRLKKQTP